MAIFNLTYLYHDLRIHFERIPYYTTYPINIAQGIIDLHILLKQLFLGTIREETKI